LLRFDELLRENQANDRYKLAVEAQKLDYADLTLKKVFGAPTATVIISACSDLQNTRAADELARAHVADGVAAVAGTVHSGSRLLTTADGQPDPKKKKRQSPGVAAASSANKGRPASAGAAAASGSSAGPVALSMDVEATGRKRLSDADRRSAAQRGDIDIVAILNGWAAGRELQSLKLRIENESFDTELDKEEALELLAACEAARSLWHDRIPKLQWNELLKNVHILTLQGIDLPASHKQHICVKVGTRAIQDGKVQEWLAVLEVERSEWDLTKPCFGACWLEDEVDAPEPLEPPQQVETIGHRWLKTVFDEPFIRLLSNPGEVEPFIFG
jgi:hypothetical protein